ncbi:MAG: hypothetical protein K6T65_11775 [Peptococcaceae bacterium]|nr:hypothetical protein [Peptococcaceae bacterium]
MPTIQQLLDDIDLRYPNSLTIAQKLYWMNRIQKEIFQEAKHEAPPYYFTTVSGQSFYPLPSDCDPDDIIKFTIETKSGSNDYNPLTFREFDSDEYVASTDEFCTVFNGNIYLNPQPTVSTAGRKVYVYYNKHPAELSESNLSASPDLQEAYRDLLVFGVVRNIAQAMKNVEIANNYASEYNVLMRKLLVEKYNKMPKYPATKDVYLRRYWRSKARERIEVVVSG